MRPWVNVCVGATAALAGCVLLALASCSPYSLPAMPTIPPDTSPLAQTPFPAPTEATTTPTPDLSPTPDCTSATGQIVEDSYPGALVEGEVPFRIYLPPCYPTAAKRLPVLYLFHGYPFDEAHWDDLGVDELAEDWIGSGETEPFILVMPRLPEPLYRSSSGGNWSYEAEMLDGLLPAVEAKYAVAATPEGRAIGGISRGGVWSLEIGMRHPELFGTVAAFSPALAVNQAGPAYDPLHLAQDEAELPLRFFLLAGETDWARPQTEILADSLRGQGADVVIFITGGGHDPNVWAAGMEPFLTYVLAGWSP